MQAFFADIHVEAASAKPALGHCALAKMAQAGKLQRHYTMNIDGLSEAAGMSVWHATAAPDGERQCDLLLSAFTDVTLQTRRSDGGDAWQHTPAGLSRLLPGAHQLAVCGQIEQLKDGCMCRSQP